MADRTKIEWCDATLNPVAGCHPVGRACAHCYASRLASRFSATGEQYAGLAKDGHWTGRVRLDLSVMDKARHWTRPRIIFLCSMGDLFYHAVPADHIVHVLNAVLDCPQHAFIVLTKRPERIRPVLYGQEGCWYLGDGDYIPNLILGTSVEDNRTAAVRLPLLLDAVGYHPAIVSVEPMLGPVDLDPWLRYMPPLWWVICGGESGPGHRPLDLAWVRALRDQCADLGVPFFFKQGEGKADPLLDGQYVKQFPAALERFRNGRRTAHR